jgi:LuxR family transcriptional regulator/LuxR family quorum-sensing system transcriptional regulator CciR
MLEIKEHENYDQLAQEFLEGVHAADTFDTLIDVCWTFASLNGVKLGCYCHLPPRGASDYTNVYRVGEIGFPEGWAEKYFDEKLYEIDPLAKYAIKFAEPYWWSELMENPIITADEKRFLEISRDYGIKDGISIPAFGPNGRNAFIGIGFGAYNVKVSPLLLARFQSMAHIGHQKYCALLNDRKKEDVNLSNREQEILQWIVKGKSNSVIADIIGISSYTVDTYLRRIFEKLGVSNRVTAALRSMSIGLI